MSNDFVGTREVVIHAIDELNLRQFGQYKVCCLYATAPFVSSFDIARALQYLYKSRSETIVFAATSFLSLSSELSGLTVMVILQHLIQYQLPNVVRI